MTLQSVVRSDGWAHFRQVHPPTAGACSPTLDLIDILDGVDVPIVVVAREFTVTCFNRAAAELLGFAPSDIGRSPGDVAVLRRLAGSGRVVRPGNRHGRSMPVRFP